MPDKSKLERCPHSNCALMFLDFSCGQAVHVVLAHRMPAVKVLPAAKCLSFQRPVFSTPPPWWRRLCFRALVCRTTHPTPDPMVQWPTSGDSLLLPIPCPAGLGANKLSDHSRALN